jgi:transforming growth factor-beta-induced protein
MFTGGILHIIDTVLTLPLTPSFTAVDSNLTALAGALTATSLLSTVDSLHDVTIFAPSNAAFQAIGSATGSLTAQQLAGILEYHVINGTVGYSTLLTSGLANESFPTVGGGELQVLVEGGEVFVNSARVIITDIIVANGVMHVLDKFVILFPFLFTSTGLEDHKQGNPKLTRMANSVLNPSNTTATPDPAAPTQAVAFSGAAEASAVPFTSGIVPTTTAPSASTKTGAGNVLRGEIGVAALFGAGVVGMIL